MDAENIIDVSNVEVLRKMKGKKALAPRIRKRLLTFLERVMMKEGLKNLVITGRKEQREAASERP